MLSLVSLMLSILPGAPPSGPAFIVANASGEPARGVISRIEADGTIVFSGESPQQVAGAEVIAMRRAQMPLPAGPMGPHVVFANGDRLAGEVLAIENGRVRFKALIGLEPIPNGTQELEIPLSALAVLWFQSPPPVSGEELAHQWSTERRRRDVVRTRNGDERTGIVKEMKGNTAPLVLKEDGDRETPLNSGLVVAIAMNTDLARTLKPRGVYSRLVLANGGRLSVLAPTAGAVALSARTLFGADVTIPLDQIVALDRRQGRATYLSEMKPTRYEHRPYLGVNWPFEMDRSVAGNEMRLGGSTYDKGIGMHSESRLSLDLNGQYQRFEALVGLDDRTGRGGRAVVRVLVDGKARDLGFEEVSFSGGPKPIRVDVTNGRTMTLVVENGPGGDVCDHVNWADARLVK